jgi:hypothetical protein
MTPSAEVADCRSWSLRVLKQKMRHPAIFLSWHASGHEVSTQSNAITVWMRFGFRIIEPTIVGPLIQLRQTLTDAVKDENSARSEFF